jgi:hypothetical protein
MMGCAGRCGWLFPTHPIEEVPMTRCKQAEADLVLDDQHYRFDTLEAAVEAHGRLAGLSGASWLHWEQTRRRLMETPPDQRPGGNEGQVELF